MTRRLIASASLAVSSLALVGCLALAPLEVGADERIPPVTDATVKKECGACHMAYPAGLLPARSWTALMSGLKSHFGENAELDAATHRTITDYLVANAADATGRRGVLRGLEASATPLRIDDLPWWKREHRELTDAIYAKPKIGSKANCGACHAGAERGNFDDD